VVGNEIAVTHAGGIAIIGGKPPIFRLPITIQEQDEIIKQNKAERFTQGIFREVDKRWRRKGHGPWLNDLLYYALLGAVAIQPRIVKVNRKPAEFHCDILDPISVYPDFGDNGTLAVARIYTTTFSHAESIAISNGWNVDVLHHEKKEFVEIINYWEMGQHELGEDPELPFNTVLMNGGLVKPREEHDLPSIPIQILPMNGIPWRGFFSDGQTSSAHLLGAQSNLTDWTMGWGRPIFHMNRALYRNLDRLLSYEAERSRRTAMGQYVASTAEGQPLFDDPNIFTNTEIITVNASENESLVALNPPQMPREALELINQVFSMVQRGGVNRLALGDLNLEISGVTLERATAAARFILEPYADGVANGLSDIAMTFFEQAKRLNLQKVSLETRQESLGAELMYQIEEFGKSDIPVTTNVDVTLPLLLPDDALRRATIARTLIPGNQPLSDMQGVAENILETQDWPSVKKRIEEDAAANSPALMAIRTMGAARRLIDGWKQDPEMQSSVPLAEQALQVMMQQFNQAAAPPEQAAGGAQARQREPSPEVSPPEAGPLPPSEMELIANQPSATNGNIAAGVRSRLQQTLQGG
jgi:hypothetical protein